ncbi:MAG: prepilin peptidase [Candidatus Magasanikbacteria bacterium]|nr:prepilin peptidase [Candidatus Magasanikbacteria bacterium]
MIIFLMFVFGALIGSFLNVVALRLPSEERFWRGRSHCVFCNKLLHWFELIPLVSFLWQGGKCRDCKKNISWRYILIEIATGGLFSGTYYFLSGQSLFYFWPTLICYLIIISVLEIIFLIDLKEGIIFDLLIWPFIVLILVFWILSGANWLIFLLSGLGCAAFFGAQYLLSRGKWIGAGDIGLGFLLGAWLGFPAILVALFFSYVVGALIGLVLIILKKKSWASSLPFAVFLIPGAFFALFWGHRIVSWYIGLVGRF